MKLKTLYLKNYGAFNEASFNFERGFNVLSGENGQGKSHVIRAINYLLLNKTHGKVEDDCNWDANSFTIKLTLEYEGSVFVVQTFFDRKKGASKELWIDDGYYSGAKDVNDTLSEYFDPSLTSAAIVSLQGDMDIVQAGDAKRRENLKKIYDLDFSKEAEVLKEEKQEIESKVDQIDKEVYSLENKQYSYQTPKRTPLTEQGYENKKKELENLRNEKALYEEKIKRNKELYEQVQSLKNQYENVVNKKDSLVQEKSKKEMEVNNLLEEKKKLIEDSESELNKIDNEIQGIKLQRIPKFDYDRLKQAEKRKNEVERDYENIKEKLQLVKQGKCPTCWREFHTDDKEEYQKEYNYIEVEFVDADKYYRDLEAEKEEVEKQKEEEEEKKRHKKELQTKLENLKENYNIKLSSIQDKIQSLQDTIEDYKNRISEHKQEEERLSKEIDSIEERRGEPIEQKNYDTPIQELEHEIKQHESILQENELIKQNNAKVEQEEKDDKEKLEQKKKDRETLVGQLSEYEQGINILKKEFPNFVISSMVNSIEDGMNELLDKAYNGRYHCKINESKNGLSIVYGSNNTDIKLSSGAEQNLFNLGFKNAFTKIAGLKVLILDEALNFANDTIASNVFNTLKHMIDNGTLEQVALITHKEVVKEMLVGDYDAQVFTIEGGKVARAGRD